MLQTQSLGASSTIDAILLDYNGTSTVPINPEQFGRADVTDFTNVTKVSPMKTLVILIHIFLNMVNNLRIYMYNSRSFAEKYTEIHWYIEIPIVINLASSNFCLPTMEL